MSTKATTKEVACKLTSPELRKRKEEEMAVLKSKVLERIELNDGYRYAFEGSDAMIDSLVEFIKTERKCCSFFTFNLIILDDQDRLYLNLTGPEGAKEFILSELDL